jgi:hypothetical protein
VRFLDEVGAQRLVRLHAVPLAAGPQVTHEREGVVEGTRGG